MTKDPTTTEAARRLGGTGNLRMRDTFSLSFRIFRVRPMRTILTIFGTSLGIGVVLFLVSLGFGLQDILLGKLAATEDSLLSIEAYYSSENDLLVKAKDIEAIKLLPEAGEVSPVGEFSGEVKTDDLSGYMLVKTVDDSFFRLSGTKPEIGKEFASNDNAVVISSTALKLLNLVNDESSIGKEISVTVLFQKNEEELATDAPENAQVTEDEVDQFAIPKTLKISGILTDEQQQPFVYIPASLLDGKEISYQRVFAKAHSLDEVQALSDKLVQGGFLISARLELVNQARKTTNIITIILGVFGAAALIVSAVGMFNTMIVSFLERIFEIGIMKSLGATSRNIRNLLLTEAMIIGLMGGIGGVLVGVIAGQLVNLGLNVLSRTYGGASISLFVYPIKFIAIIIVLSGFVGIAAGFWPARKAVMLSPKEAFIRK